MLMYQIRSDPPSSNWSPYKKRGIWPQRHVQRENTQGEAEIGVGRHRGWYRNRYMDFSQGGAETGRGGGVPREGWRQKKDQRAEKEVPQPHSLSARTNEQTRVFFHQQVELGGSCQAGEDGECPPNKRSFSSCLGMFLKVPVSR